MARVPQSAIQDLQAWWAQHSFSGPPSHEEAKQFLEQFAGRWMASEEFWHIKKPLCWYFGALDAVLEAERAELTQLATETADGFLNWFSFDREGFFSIIRDTTNWSETCFENQGLGNPPTQSDLETMHLALRGPIQKLIDENKPLGAAWLWNMGRLSACVRSSRNGVKLRLIGRCGRHWEMTIQRQFPASQSVDSSVIYLTH